MLGNATDFIVSRNATRGQIFAAALRAVVERVQAAG